jgi:hypothetical protein
VDFKCPVNYDINNCSSKEYGLACKTCFHMDFRKIYEECWNKFGATFQIMICLEEFSELQKELIKWLRGKDNIHNIEEEMADVELLLSQIKYGLNLNQENIDKIKLEKIERLKTRM